MPAHARGRRSVSTFAVRTRHYTAHHIVLKVSNHCVPYSPPRLHCSLMLCEREQLGCPPAFRCLPLFQTPPGHFPAFGRSDFMLLYGATGQPAHFPPVPLSGAPFSSLLQPTRPAHVQTLCYAAAGPDAIHSPLTQNAPLASCTHPPLAPRPWTRHLPSSAPPGIPPPF